MFQLQTQSNQVSESFPPDAPLKGRAFDFDFFQSPTQFVTEMKETDTPASLAFSGLLDWSGLQRQPLYDQTPVLGVCGNSLIAAGLAMRLANSTPSHGKTPYKIALLEWGQPSPMVHNLFEMTHNEGLSELFADRCDLEHLIVSAKVCRALPSLYVLGQGELQPAWFLTLPKLSALLRAFRKKFHRVVLSLPSLAQQPDLPRVLKSLQLPYVLLYDPEETVPVQFSELQATLPLAIFQRLS